jgi:tetratricopeptide (TPR) repeat protein
LEKAIDSYETALKIGMTDENLHERAIFGLARAYEAVAGTRAGQGQLDQAVEQYEKLVEQWPNGIYISIAKERLTALKTTSEKEFYDIFAATQDQTAPTSPGMGLDPEDLREVPEGPDEDLMESAGLSFDLEEPEQDDQNEGAPATNGEDTETTDSQLSDAPAAPPEIGTSDDVPASDNDSAETATPSPPEEEKEKNENDAAETSPQPAEQ